MLMPSGSVIAVRQHCDRYDARHKTTILPDSIATDLPPTVFEYHLLTPIDLQPPARFHLLWTHRV
eukprot:84815-Rhodomonas_salina.3